MSNPATQDIKERERINATLERFYSQPTWTPAMGALLVSGVLPMGRNTKIPEDGAASLRDPAIHARQDELLDARNVLRDWVTWDTYRMEEGEIEEPSSSIKPIEFLMWCDEEYESRSEMSKPGWLGYWNSFIGKNARPNVPLPAPSPLVARAVELEHVASFIRVDSGDSYAGPKQSATRSETEAYVARMTDAMLNSRTPIGPLIAQALAAADDPRVPASVWTQLRRMAENNEYPALKWIPETATMKIPSGESGWRVYTRDALQQYLRNYRIKAGLVPDVERTSSPGDEIGAG